MQKHRKLKKKWVIAIGGMLCTAFLCYLLLAFDIGIFWSIIIIESLVLVSLGECFIKHYNEEKETNSHLLWAMISVIIFTLIIYFIERGSYISSKSYINWLKLLLKRGEEYIDFKIATLSGAFYLVFIGVYGKAIWYVLKYKMSEWLPSFLYLVVGINIMLYTRERMDHSIRIMTLLMTGILLTGHLLFRYILNKEQKVVYHFSTRRYLCMFGICLMITSGIGLVVPKCHELPGNRWVRSMISTFSGDTDIGGKIPFQSYLNDDISVSDAILFEVTASEELYLRSIAYKEYKDGAWRLSAENEIIDSNISLEPQYWQAEYSQIKSLLKELAYQNSQNRNLFTQYKRLASYESTVAPKKQYTVLQNPINKINYLTTNGVSNIQDTGSSNIYYYETIDNCYFYGDKVIEPSNYTVEYYDYVPKIGSREYMFLRYVNTDTWQKIYKEVVQNRVTYGYYCGEVPNILLNYTPIIQYTNAKRDFLQVPDELRLSLEQLTKTITDSQQSDWMNAEAICNYIREHYTYSLHSKYDGKGDRIYHFLFEEKQGICQEFASSMVLMCRSIGIPAKYVTGYRVSEKNPQTGNYIVREKDAHAFVEVYIAGYGWMSFDPTPEEDIDETNTLEGMNWVEVDYVKVFGILVLIFGIFVFSKGEFFFVQEIIWKVRLYFSSPDKKIEKIMIRTCKWIECIGYSRAAYETLSKYASRLKEYEIEIGQVVSIYEFYRYGNQKPDKEQLRQAYSQYIELRKKIKK